MKLNEKGLKLIMDFEGFRSTAYKDQGGVLTIGYGHTGNVKTGDSITLEKAKSLLLKDIDKKTKSILPLIGPNLNDNQFSALVSFAYNLGPNALKVSQLLSHVNDSKFDLAAEEFHKWDHVNGVEVPGLLRRRLAERDLFLDTEGV